MEPHLQLLKKSGEVVLLLLKLVVENGVSHQQPHQQQREMNGGRQVIRVEATREDQDIRLIGVCPDLIATCFLERLVY